MTMSPLPKGIKLISSTPAAAVTHPPGHPQGAVTDPKGNVDANIKTAAEMHVSLGQKIEDAAKWLFNTLPGVFSNIEAAIKAIKAVIAAV